MMLNSVCNMWKFDLQAAVMHLMWTPNKRTKHLPRNLSQHRQGVSSKDQTAFLDIPWHTIVDEGLIRNQLVFKKPWYSLRGHGKTLDCESLALDGAVVEKQQVLADVRDGCLGWLSFVGFFGWKNWLNQFQVQILGSSDLQISSLVVFRQISWQFRLRWNGRRFRGFDLKRIWWSEVLENGWNRWLAVLETDRSYSKELSWCQGAWWLVFFNQATGAIRDKECQCLPSHSTLTFAIPCCFYGTLPQSSSKVFEVEGVRPSWETPKFRGFRGTSKCRNEKFDEAYPLRINISHQKRQGKSSTHKWRLFNRIFLSFPRRVWSFPLQGFHSKWCHKLPQRLDVIAATFFMEVCCLQWRW